MSHLENENLLIIYGGRGKINNFFDDLEGFNLINFTWFKIPLLGDEIPSSSYGHANVIVGD